MSSTIPISSSNSTASASVYGSTPGGTPRISYSRDQLLNLASSPLSRSPPAFDVPAAISRTPKVGAGVWDVPASASVSEEREEREEREEERESEGEAEAFAMDL